jgi:anaerobic selenocysteine-containing dehydrogenase
MAAVGTASALYGCGGGGDDEVIYAGGGGGGGIPAPNVETDEYYFGSGGHNCGNSARCLLKAWVKDGRIVRITSDDSTFSGSGVYQNPDNPMVGTSKACARCRSYRHRIYHPGRLKYPLKQTKERGNLSGFVRLSWDDALLEIAKKHYAITDKYGYEAVHCLYACGSYSGSLQGGGYSGVWAGNSATNVPANLMGGYTAYSQDYSFHQSYFGGNGNTGYGTLMGGAHGINGIASYMKTVVLFGSNNLSTQNPFARSIVGAAKEMRKRPGAQIIHISPEFVDTGVNIATKWIQIKPYTDAALIMGMIHEMIINTFDEHGNIYPDDPATMRPYLKADYLDSVCYGFFDSPEYWIKKGNTAAAPTGVDQGTVSLTEPVPATGWTRVDAVPAGKSFSAYIMGNDPRLTEARYDAGSVYIAKEFSAVQTFRNMDTCTQTIKTVPANTITGVPDTKYQRKKEYMTPKSAGWASGITGIPEDEIKSLAKLFCTPDAMPMCMEWSGAFQKQANGVIGLITLQVLNIIAGTYANITRNGMGSTSTGGGGATAMPNISRPSGSGNLGNQVSPSVSQWHNAIKFAFGDVLKANGYTGKYIPDWGEENIGQGKVYHDDGGTKALLKWKRSLPNRNIDTDADGYFVPDTDSGGNLIYSGYRFIINSGGNILMNQHMNPNDSKDMFERIPSCGQTNDPNNPDDLCLVSFDPFLSPSPRWSDYVLPAATMWEMDNRISLTIGGAAIIMPVVSEPPGEALSTYNFTRKLLETYEQVDPSKAGIANTYIGADSVSQAVNNEITYSEDTTITFTNAAGVNVEFPEGGYAKVDSGPITRYFHGDTETFPQNSVVTFYAGTKVLYTSTASGSMPVIPGDQLIDKFRRAYERTQYAPTSPYYRKSFDEALKLQYVSAAPGTMSTTTATPTIAIKNTIETYLARSDRDTVPFYLGANASGGNGYSAAYPTGVTAPVSSGRCELVMRASVFQYEHCKERYHGWLPADMRGQKNADIEGDPIFNLLPFYYNYEDYFMEAFGNDPAKLPPENNRFLVTTTHDRFRAHSSYSEAPYARELTHRTRGGGPYSGHDWGTYALSSSSNGSIPRLNKSIQDKDYVRASWSEAWMNNEDAAAFGIRDGDIIEMRNPIGAVRVAARVTKRAVRGFIGLHQGCWYDPDPEDGVDDGGCANTIMASKPSRVDHGNGQQCAMVSIKKVF